ncbi:MAG: hypothetical protein GY842_14505, partial [bacterium]|nr:hypothetical protein [bacterium]
ITSLVAPIMTGDVFHGMAGVDLRLAFLQEMANDVEGLYDGTARITLVSNNGTIAGVTGQPELVGKHMKVVDEHWEEELEVIRAGRKEVESEGDYIEALVPLKVGLTTTPWAVNVKAPRDKVTAEAEAQMSDATRDMWIMIAIAAIFTLGAASLMWLMAMSIARPINRVIGGLAGCADQVASASDQIAGASQSLASGTSEQAASIEETSSSLEETASMTKHNADNANQANTLMKDS